MLKRGRKSRHWDHIRSQIKREFFEQGITRCEQCGTGYNLSFAHRYKRRFITDDAELKMVALLCIPCHQTIETSGHQQMFTTITQIIDKRGRI